MRRKTSTVTIDRLAYIAVGACVLVITWNGLRAGGGALANAFLVVAFAAVLAQTAVARRPVPLPPFLLAAGAGLVLAAMLNVIFPPDSGLINQTLLQFRVLPGTPPDFLVPRSDTTALIQFGIGLVLIPAMIASVATTPKRIDRLLDLFVIGTTASAVVGLVDVAGFHIAPVQTGSARSAGLTIHPNYLALSCTIGIPLALLWITRPGRWRIAGLMSAAILLAGAYASGSRIGAVSSVLAVVVTVMVIPRLRRGLGVVIPAAGMVLLALIFFAGQEVLEQVRFGNDTSTAVNTAGSNSQRAQLADLAIHQFEERPLQGVGFGVIADAHNIYLQLLAAGGLIAMGSFLVFLGGLWGAVSRALAGPQREAVAAAGVAILMWLVNGLYDNQVADKYLFVVPGLLLAMAAIAAAMVPAQERRTTLAGSRRRPPPRTPPRRDPASVGAG